MVTFVSAQSQQDSGGGVTGFIFSLSGVQLGDLLVAYAMNQSTGFKPYFQQPGGLNQWALLYANSPYFLWATPLPAGAKASGSYNVELAGFGTSGAPRGDAAGIAIYRGVMSFGHQGTFSYSLGNGQTASKSLALQDPNNGLLGFFPLDDEGTYGTRWVAPQKTLRDSAYIDYTSAAFTIGYALIDDLESLAGTGTVSANDQEGPLGGALTGTGFALELRSAGGGLGFGLSKATGRGPASSKSGNLWLTVG